ncbi:MAG: putative baseplate assembly protein, partial [Anaerolineaceae bacterium]
MPIPYPPLDDRRFQDIVDEAKKRIPQYCKEWTDHNVSDPGVTMIELFAWMTDMLLYRLNRVPDLHYVRFMEMLGITLKSPQPAKVPVTFWLSAPQSAPVTIPAATEVSSIQTERERPIIFSTDEDLVIHPPALKKVYSRMASASGDKKSLMEHNLRRLESGFDGASIFTELPQLDDAIYFGFENDLSHHILGFDFDFDPAGVAGIDPTMPPYIWEASAGEESARWETCALEMDTTRGMNGAGRIQIHLPTIRKQEVNQESLYWVRARVIELSETMRRDGARPYRLSPRLRRMSAGAWGGTTPATHAQTVRSEFLGRSDGTPGQRYNLKQKPVLQRKPGQTLIVQTDGQPPQEWREVNDFADSWADDHHFTVDNVSGEIRLGPAIRQQDGTIKLYGAVPPRGANLLFSAYSYGGGQEGNVQKGIL